MRSQLAVRLGADLPQIIHEPPDVASLETARDTLELAARYEIIDGEQLSPSQELRILNGMAERPDGLWAARRVGDFGPRQTTGKTAVIIARIFGGIFLVGEKLTIYTAHEFQTANEVFIRVGAVLDAWDDFSGLVTKVHRAHGDQGYDLKGPRGHEITGARRLLFKTRTGGALRGFDKAGLLIYDEAQHLKTEQVAGSGPTKLANRRAQSWWSGSGGLAVSQPAWAMRRDALRGTGGRLSYTEHTAQTWAVRPDGQIEWFDPDPDDRDARYRANPGLGRWVTEEDFVDMQKELGHLFPREGLCVWEPELGEDGESPVDPTAWALCADPDSQPPLSMQWALVVSPDRKWATFGMAGRRDDGRVHVEVLVPPDGVKPGVGWIVAGAKALASKFTEPLRIHRTGPEAAYLAPLKEAGLNVVEVSSAEAAQATGQFIDFANTRQIAHRSQPQLDVALRGAVLRESSDGAVIWSQRNSQTEITPLMACTVALGGVPQDAPEFFVY